MGRTLSTATQLILDELRAFSNFRRALRREDQLVFDELFTFTRKHIAAIGQAAHALPFEAMLLSMLLEEHKELMRLRRIIDDLKQKQAD